MKSIYISGALMGSTNPSAARDLYTRFAVACERAGWSAYLPHQNTDPVHAPEISSDDVMRRDLAELSSAEAVLAYLGEPSLGVGAEVAIAMQLNKPIIAVYSHDRPVSRFIRGLLNHYDKTTTCSYDTVDEACECIYGVLRAGVGRAHISSELPAAS